MKDQTHWNFLDILALGFIVYLLCGYWKILLGSGIVLAVIILIYAYRAEILGVIGKKGAHNSKQSGRRNQLHTCREEESPFKTLVQKRCSTVADFYAKDAEGYRFGLFVACFLGIWILLAYWMIVQYFILPVLVILGWYFRKDLHRFYLAHKTFLQPVFAYAAELYAKCRMKWQMLRKKDPLCVRKPE